MIKNPILKGFNPDPSICRVGDDYYNATSTFEVPPAFMIGEHRCKICQIEHLRKRLLQQALSGSVSSVNGVRAPICWVALSLPNLRGKYFCQISTSF
ncbi:MAG TPA: family 43 glycosylhydrolase [Cellvibrionaceae bacterium]